MVATTQEQIDEQHALSVQRCARDKTAGAPPPSIGEINLQYKRFPVVELPPDSEISAEDVPKCSTRGVIDVTALKRKVWTGHGFESTSKNPKPPEDYDPDENESDYWDEEICASQNVCITRPSHDKWGIKKIVLIFCDDYLRRVYEMPYFWKNDDCPRTKFNSTNSSPSPTFVECIKPILSTLNLWDSSTSSPSPRVVRLLLASLPPGITIPVHHDTGYWVERTHRVHVPVIVPNGGEKVLFTVGGEGKPGGVDPSQGGGERVDLTEGRVFEMNNQHKHAVSNCSEFYRVHLILDYIDEETASAPNFEGLPSRVPLERGETLIQTRRTIDRKCDYGEGGDQPRFLILGAQKAGTTSLFESLCSHPLVIRPKRRETHFFDWRWQPGLKKTSSQRDFYKNFFYSDEMKAHPSLITGESTPSYLLSSDVVIPRVKAVAPWVKLIVMVRDPVERAWSHYRMVTADDGTEAQRAIRGRAWEGMSFEEVVAMEMRQLEKYGLGEGMFHNVVNKSKEEQTEALEKYLKSVPMGSGSHSLIVRGLYYLQLLPWKEAGFELLVLNLKNMAANVEREVFKAYDFLGLPKERLSKEGTEAKNVRPPKKGDKMGQAVHDRLTKYYTAWDQLFFDSMRWEGDDRKWR